MTSKNHLIRRRNVLKAIGGGIVLGVAGASSASARPNELSHQLNGVRAATRKYTDIETARDDDYFDVSPYVPEMGFHFANELLPFGTEREDPPILVYFTNGGYNPDPFEEHDPEHDDDLILGGVEYAVPGDQTADPPDIFTIGYTAPDGFYRSVRRTFKW